MNESNWTRDVRRWRGENDKGKVQRGEGKSNEMVRRTIGYPSRRKELI